MGWECGGGDPTEVGSLMGGRGRGSERGLFGWWRERERQVRDTASHMSA